MEIGVLEGDFYVDMVTYEQAVGSDKWYNLKGQQIETPTQKGIYIQNRKKIIIK